MFETFPAENLLLTYTKAKAGFKQLYDWIDGKKKDYDSQDLHLRNVAPG